MSTLQQALVSAGLSKKQPTEPIVHQNSFQEDPRDGFTLGVNQHGNKQYFHGVEPVCPECGERYINKILGVDCDMCQKTPLY